MKRFALIALALLTPLLDADPEPALFVRSTNAAACQWLQPFSPTPCVQNILAVAYQLPPQVRSVRFELSYLDHNGAPVTEVILTDQNAGQATAYRPFGTPSDAGNLFSSVRVTATTLAITGKSFTSQDTH